MSDKTKDGDIEKRRDEALRRALNTPPMVDRIGVQRKWVQRPPKTSWLHFDIAKSKRTLAIAAGAVETGRYGPALHVAHIRGNNKMIDTVARLRARKEPKLEES